MMLKFNSNPLTDYPFVVPQSCFPSLSAKPRHLNSRRWKQQASFSVSIQASVSAWFRSAAKYFGFESPGSSMTWRRSTYPQAPTSSRFCPGRRGAPQVHESILTCQGTEEHVPAAVHLMGSECALSRKGRTLSQHPTPGRTGQPVMTLQSTLPAAASIRYHITKYVNYTGPEDQSTHLDSSGSSKSRCMTSSLKASRQKDP